MENRENNTQGTLPLAALQSGNLSQKEIRVFCDGYFKVRPSSIGTWSFIVLDADGNIVKKQSGFVGRGEGITTFVAGYKAVLKALRWILDNKPDTPIKLHSDLEIVVSQILGEWKCRDEKLIPLNGEAMALLEKLPQVEITLIKGANNELAKSISRQMYQEELTKPMLVKKKPSWAKRTQKKGIW